MNILKILKKTLSLYINSPQEVINKGMCVVVIDDIGVPEYYLFIDYLYQWRTEHDNMSAYIFPKENNQLRINWLKEQIKILEEEAENLQE